MSNNASAVTLQRRYDRLCSAWLGFTPELSASHLAEVGMSNGASEHPEQQKGRWLLARCCEVYLQVYATVYIVGRPRLRHLAVDTATAVIEQPVKFECVGSSTADGTVGPTTHGRRATQNAVQPNCTEVCLSNRSMRDECLST